MSKIKALIFDLDGTCADTLGAIVGSIAEAIWGIPMEIRETVESYLPDEMNDVLEQFYHERWRSFKPLIDTTFDGMTFDEAAWDMLDSDEKKKIQDFVLAGKVDKRRLPKPEKKFENIEKAQNPLQQKIL